MLLKKNLPILLKLFSVLGILAIFSGFYSSYTIENSYDEGFHLEIFTSPPMIIAFSILLLFFILMFKWNNRNFKKELFGVFTVFALFFIGIIMYLLIDFLTYKETKEDLNPLIKKGLDAIFSGTFKAKNPAPKWLHSLESISLIAVPITGLLSYTIIMILYIDIRKKEKHNNDISSKAQG